MLDRMAMQRMQARVVNRVLCNGKMESIAGIFTRKLARRVPVKQENALELPFHMHRGSMEKNKYNHSIGSWS